MLARTAIMEITTNSSIRVNAAKDFDFVFIVIIMGFTGSMRTGRRHVKPLIE
jgi:hypothetical protein